MGQYFERLITPDNVNVKDKVGVRCNSPLTLAQDGHTALHRAAQNSMPIACDALIRGGANIRAKDKVNGIFESLLIVGSAATRPYISQPATQHLIAAVC